MVLIPATLNWIWGIAAIDGTNFFVEDERYVLSDRTMRDPAAHTLGERGLVGFGCDQSRLVAQS